MSANLAPSSSSTNKPDYDLLYQQAQALFGEIRDAYACAANLSALLYHALPMVNWLGFYFVKDGELLVGPFQGQPACVQIPLGRGVCGQAAESGEPLRVADVHAHSDHIVCDAASNSEIVLPLMHRGDCLGVLDIDSPQFDRFDAIDEAGLSRLAALYVNHIDRSSI